VNVVLISRYPRMDLLRWKRDTGEGILSNGHLLSLVFSRSTTSAYIALAREILMSHGIRFQSRAYGGDGPGAGPATLYGWAKARGIDTVAAGRLDDARVLHTIERWEPDLAVLVGADIVPGPVIDLFPAGIINAHFGALPTYRGMNVAEWAIFHNDPVAVTVHFADRGVDTGDVISYAEIPVWRGDNLASIRQRQRETAALLLPAAVNAISGGKAMRVPQQADAGRQFYRMHPVLRQRVEERLATGQYKWMRDVRQGDPIVE
jgi:folate-dependent phosphoribosylglycinamide formyltransferase PurN